MRERGGSASAVWIACVGIGLLFLARGAFQPYIFPLFDHLGGFTYTQTALILNGYVLAQSVCAPAAGWFADRTTLRAGLVISIVLGSGSFLLIAAAPPFLVAAAAVFTAGLAFVLAKISLNTTLVLHSSRETLRRSVANRATLLNLGSFLGNGLAYLVTTRVGYHAHAVLLGLLYAPLAIGLAAPTPEPEHEPTATLDAGGFRTLVQNRAFLADALRRFAVVFPYGCWGTVIPKYVIDAYGSTDKVWVVYLTSLCTTVVGANVLASYASDALYRRGFRWEWWSMVSVLFYCAGLWLLTLAAHPPALVAAVVVFICGEVIMTPCFDETAKKHSGAKGMASCLGVLHFVDGLGRMLGAAFALAVYGAMKDTPQRDLYWTLVVVVFGTTGVLVHAAAHFLAGGAGRSAGGESTVLSGGVKTIGSAAGEA